MAKNTECSQETRLFNLSLSDLSPSAFLEAVEETKAKHPFHTPYVTPVYYKSYTGCTMADLVLHIPEVNRSKNVFLLTYTGRASTNKPILTERPSFRNQCSASKTEALSWPSTTPILCHFLASQAFSPLCFFIDILEFQRM